MHSTEYLRVSSISVTEKKKEAWLLPSGSSKATGVNRQESSKCMYVRLQLLCKLWEEVHRVLLTPVGDQKTLSWANDNRAVIWRRNRSWLKKGRECQGPGLDVQQWEWHGFLQLLKEDQHNGNAGSQKGTIRWDRQGQTGRGLDTGLST